MMTNLQQWFINATRNAKVRKLRIKILVIKTNIDFAVIVRDRKIFLQFFSKRTRKLSIKNSILSMIVTRLRKSLNKKLMKANRKN